MTRLLLRAAACRASLLLVLASALLVALPALSASQAFDSVERDRARQMLDVMKDLLKTRYYDPTFRGIDLEEHFKAAREKLDQAGSIGHAYGIIAQALLDLNDSHTFFVPPGRPTTYDYGWDVQMVGDDCYVVAVNPRSDAAGKGLRPGDRLLELDSRVPSRANLWRLQYAYNLLSPRASLTVVVQGPGEEPRTLDLKATVVSRPVVQDVDIDNLESLLTSEREERVRASRMERVGGIRIWKLPAFDVSGGEMDRLARQAMKDATDLVLDLRGNGGGAVVSLEQLTRCFFDRDVKLADIKERKKAKPLVVKKRGGAFTGRLVVLVDSASASASEMFARVVQLEKRGVVMGDRSSGSVMRAQLCPAVIELADTFIFYGASITDAELVMSDGTSLEGVGVEPDELLLPSAEDMRAGRDPVLSRAVASLGGTLDPAAAGAMFPVRWEAGRKRSGLN